MRSIAAVLRLLAFVIGTLVILPFHLAVRALTGSLDTTRWWHRMACRVFNIKINLHGEVAEAGAVPVLYLANHISYLDIIVLGGVLRGMFVAKSEVAGWPGFGYLAKTQNTIFIVRQRDAIDESQKAIAQEMRTGHNVILFGEGTSTDGRRVNPFKSILLDILYTGAAEAIVQPVAIVIERVAGQKPDDQSVRDTYAWWKPEDELAPHLWAFAKAGGAEIGVHFLPVIDPRDFPDRKALADAATSAVAAQLPQ